MTDSTDSGTVDAGEQLIRWALARVRSHLQRHGVRLTLGGGELGDTFVGVDEIQRTLSGRGSFDLAAQLGLEEAEPIDFPGDAPGPCATLATRFGLDALSIRLLAAAAAPALSIDLQRLYTFAWADFTVRRPWPAFLAELVTDTPGEALAALSAFDPTAPLMRGALLRFDPQPALDAPVTHAGVIVPANVVRFLRGGTPALPAPADDARIVANDTPGAPPPRLRALLDGDARRMLLCGEPGVGRLAAFIAAVAPRAVLAVDLDRLPVDLARFERLIVDLVREARLRDQALFLSGDHLFADPEAPRLDILVQAIRHSPGLVALAARNAIGRLERAGVRLPRIDMPMPDRPTQRTLWQAALTAHGIADDTLAERLVQRFNATPGAIRAAVAEGVSDAALDAAPVAIPHVARAVRRRINHALDVIAEPMTTTLTWDDVVLPQPIRDTLLEIRAQARNRLRVFDEWGFRRKLAYGRGLACLFTGPPGTGKTMMAGIIAQELGRELYRVDLSRVVSKWVGETEKNLARIFDEAERAQVILFFDEADSLFATRTEVKGANDRFANMEVNYLLQRMESFDGMTILTTNFERGLDEAFRRRLRFRVHFPLPDPDERAALWARMIPPQTPIDDAINFAGLGRRYKLSGGNIKNAVLRAAFYAAEAGTGLTTALCVQAAEAESREMGRL